MDHHEDAPVTLPQKPHLVVERHGKIIGTLPLSGILPVAVEQTSSYLSDLDEKLEQAEIKKEYIGKHRAPEPEQVVKIIPKAGRLKKAVAAFTTAAVLAGGGIGVKALSNSQETGNPQPDKVTTAPVVPAPPTKQNQPELTTIVCAVKGDNMWKMVQNTVHNTGREPTIPLTNALVTMAAEKNIATIPNPDDINIGQCAELPNDKVITVVFDALSQPNDLTVELQTVNNQTDITKKEAVAKQGSIIKNIWNKVKNKI